MSGKEQSTEQAASHLEKRRYAVRDLNIVPAVPIAETAALPRYLKKSRGG
jgi:hypothetical protein